MQMHPPLANSMPITPEIKESKPSKSRRVLIASIALLLIGGGTFLAFIYFSETTENSPLAGSWMQSNGEVYTIKADGSGSNPSCDNGWSIKGNETTYSSDCTDISPNGEPLWSERIYSYEFVGDVLFMKLLSVEDQDGFDAAPSDILCTAWVLEELAPDASAWENIVNSTAMPEMCSGIAGLTE